jgi:VanZ family protein
MARFVRYQLPAYLWALLIYLSSAMPARFFEQFGISYPWASKAVHVLFYFFLCFFLNRAFRHQQTSPFLARFSLPLSIVLCLLFGAGDEMHQMYVASRHPRVTDVLLDMAGASFMAATLWVWERFQSLRRERIPS